MKKKDGMNSAPHADLALPSVPLLLQRPATVRFCFLIGLFLVGCFVPGLLTQPGHPAPCAEIRLWQAPHSSLRSVAYLLHRVPLAPGCRAPFFMLRYVVLTCMHACVPGTAHVIARLLLVFGHPGTGRSPHTPLTHLVEPQAFDVPCCAALQQLTVRFCLDKDEFSHAVLHVCFIPQPWNGTMIGAQLHGTFFFSSTRHYCRLRCSPPPPPPHPQYLAREGVTQNPHQPEQAPPPRG
jgi:hypothetical protein